MDRADSITSRYSAPTAETVIDFSDDENAGLDGRISPSGTPYKKPIKRRHKVSSDLASPSHVPAEKERRKRQHRTRPRTSSSPSSTKRHSIPRSPVEPWLPEELIPDPEIDDGRYFQTPGRSGGYRRAGISRRDSLLSNTSTGTVRKPTPLSQNEDLLNQERPRDTNKSSTACPQASLPYHTGSKLSASVTSNLTSFSGMTTASGGSSGSSNSTVIQTSLSKSKSTARIRKEPKGPSTESSPLKEGISAAVPRRQSVEVKSSAEKPGVDKPNVFSYLQDEPATAQWSAVPISTSARDGRDSSPRSTAGNSFSSDSGISVGGESPETQHAKLEERPRVKPCDVKSAARAAFEPLFARQRERAASNTSSPYMTGHLPPMPPTSVPLGVPPPLPSQWIDMTLSPVPIHPLPYQHASPDLHQARPTSRSSNPPSPQPDQVPENKSTSKRDISGMVQGWFKKPECEKPASNNLAGYELLTSKLSTLETDCCGKTSKLVPLYRRFESLNHRLFLHLQDEVAELEEELRMLDETDKQCRVTSAASMRQEPGPASRRQGANMSSDIEWRRIDVLGRIFTKVGHYNQALSSYSNLVNSLDPATGDDVAKYRNWMTENNPIVEPETRFLQQDEDLMAIKRKNVSHFQSSEAVISLMATVIAVAVLLPILSFKVVSDFLARVVVVIIVAGASMSVLVQSQRADVIMGRHGRKYAAIYVGIMAVVAGVIR